VTPERFQRAAYRWWHPRMARRWLVDSFVAGYDVELKGRFDVGPDTIEAAQAEADERRERHAKADPQTHAVARDQYNRPITPIVGNRMQRRKEMARRRKLARKAAKR
jgi:hypothetical protein